MAVGGIRWSVADLGTGAEGTVSLLPGSWVPGAPWLADQPLTKSWFSGHGIDGHKFDGHGIDGHKFDGHGIDLSAGRR